METPIYPAPDAPTRLLNLQHVDENEFDVYIGGETEMYDLDESIHHNPYRVSEYGRQSAIAHYRAFFYKKYLTEKDYRVRVHELWGQTLAEWNYPEHCHGEVIIDLLTAHHEQGFEGAVDHITEELGKLNTSDLGPEGLKNQATVTELISEYTQ